MNKYYYVYLRGDKPPSVRHPTLKGALEEAHRLALKHPGKIFEVLRAVSHVSTNSEVTVRALI